MVQKSGEKTTWDGAKTYKNRGNNEMHHQPQLVSRISSINSMFIKDSLIDMYVILIEYLYDNYT